MNNTDQSQYYNNPAATHGQTANFYMQNNGMDPQYGLPLRNPGQYPTRMNPPSYNYSQMPNGFQQPFFLPQAYPQNQFMPSTNPRPMNPSQIPIIRPANETMNNYQHFIPQNGYPPTQYTPGNNSLPSAPSVYPGQFYPTYQIPSGYATQQVQTQMANQPQISQQQAYIASLQTSTQIHPTQPVQHTTIDQPSVSVPTSQPQIPPNIQQPNSYVAPPAVAAPVVLEKRKKNPLTIVNPETHKPVEVSASSSSTPATTASVVSSTITSENRSSETTTTDSTIANAKSTNDTNKIQKQTQFRQQFATNLGVSSNVQTDKNTTQSTTSTASSEDSSAAASLKQNVTKQSENPVQQSTSSRSGSISRPKSPVIVSLNDTSATPSKESTSSTSSEKPQPGHPGILVTRNVTDDKVVSKTIPDDIKEKRDRSDSLKQIESEPMETIEKTNDNLKLASDDATPVVNQEASSIVPESQSTTSSFDGVTPPQTPTIINDEKSDALPNQRLRYDRHELLRIRDSSAPFPIPQHLPDLDIVINRRDNNPRFSYNGTNSQGRVNPPFHRQLSSSNHPSLTRYPNNANSATDSRRKPGIYLSAEPDFSNRVENPYKPIDQATLDVNKKVLRDVKAILNKVTPQTFDKLQKKLEALEIDRYEKLEGMITIFFSKAVDEPAFSFLYAKLCKQFQKKQVTVPGDDGKLITHYFRQILLTRCQKEFENDYRQEIEYEKRKAEVETLTDDKKRKDEAEKLEEDLVKAKRRKLGNIFFIGELFKLQMLTDTIMYDCIEYLLRDKSDEESIECLCRLLRTIGKELDGKALEKTVNKTNLEKHYRELDGIIKEQKTSARIRFMIQDLMELRQAAWVARRAEAKPTTIDEIHEQERLKREQQERDQERDRQQRRDPNRSTVIGSTYSGSNQPQYNDGRGSRGSGIKQQLSRNDDDRVENRFSVNSLRQLQSNDKRNQGPFAMNLAPQRTWTKGSGIDKKPEEDRSFGGRTGKPPAGPIQQLKGKVNSSQGGSTYPMQRQSSRELARENSHRDRENALQSLRKTTTGSGVNSPVNAAGTSSMTNSREGSRNVSREQSRNASRESSVSERMSNIGSSVQSGKASSESTTIINQDPSNTTFDEEKTIARVHSLIEEYTENYSNLTDRPVKEALEDLAAFCTRSLDQQAIIVRELFTNVLEAKSRARRAVGHLLDAAHNDDNISETAFVSGVKMIIEAAPDYAVDIPLIWQYIGEILGAFIGAPTSNMAVLKPIFECVPDDKAKQFFQFTIRYATEFSSQSRIQRFWQSSGFSLNDLMKADLIDSTFSNEFDWLFDTPEVEQSTSQTKENHSPHPDPQLVKLFKSVNDQGTTITDPEIITYIREHMDPSEKFYIRNIVLSYLEACLINRDPQKKIQEDIAKKRMTVLNAIIEHKSEAEIQAVYAIQNFVNKLEHPPKMARLLFDIFYDEECVSEDAFFEWLKHPDQSETEGHAVVEISTKDFFTWLQQAETEVEEGEEEEGS
ncbi:unnamed protein product [Rotaria magnacalcarata]|uniref:Uncharacterized protein n=1 Tax=Rotaria magnacalcarata TaxID=392030 RepID=A0A816R065_9BILA|nr:unnamed protein product [Rotaria magnacalcarata]CAF3849621.1 unnamed protein product [Rotaria magnacalcarata]